MQQGSRYLKPERLIISLHWLHLSQLIIFKVAVLKQHARHDLILHVSPACKTYISSGLPVNRSMFCHSIGLWSDVVPFLLLDLKCGTVYLKTWHLPHHYLFSGTGWNVLISPLMITN